MKKGADMDQKDSFARKGDQAAPPGLRLGAAEQGAAEEMHRRIIDTAESLFRQFGYQKTTVAEIAEELGMSPANVYRFFASKGAICEAVVRKLAADVRERIREAVADPHVGAAERLRTLVTVNHDEVAKRCISDKRMHAMVHAAIEQNWTVSQDHQEGLRRMAAEIIADGVAAGEFDVGDVETASHCFQAAMISACHPLILENRIKAGEDVESMVAPMIDFALRGLGARAVLAGSPK